jgi:hypothetical protein
MQVAASLTVAGGAYTKIVRTAKSNSNSFVNGLCIPVFAKNSTKLLSNGLANELCIFVNLAKS